MFYNLKLRIIEKTCTILKPMPIIKRNDVATLLAAINKGQASPIYLVIGDRFLCQTTVQDLLNALLPDPGQRSQNCRSIDGTAENPETTLRQLRTHSLFPGRQVFKVTDSLLFSSKSDAKALWGKASKAYEVGDSKLAARLLSKMLAMAEIKPSEILNLSAAEWKTQLAFERPDNISWLKEILAEQASANGTGPIESTGGGDIVERFTQAFEAGIPAKNILIMTAETVDRRKRFFKFIKEHCTVIDLEADLAGNTTAARKEQDLVIRNLVSDTLKRYGKTMPEAVMSSLLERVGFHPVAAVMETEKIALYAGDSRSISMQDLDTMIGRTRETALYEFNEAFAGRDLDKILIRLGRLLEDGMHSLAIVAGLRNHIKKLLLVAAIERLPEPVYSAQQYGAFQKDYLPRLKATLKNWPKALDGHPYALHMTFRQAEKFSVLELQKALAQLLEAEYRLKGSQLPASLIIENFLLGLFLAPDTANQARKSSRRSTAL